MYANLRVSLANGEQMFAWKVEVGASTVVVHVDDPNDESKYTAPIGERIIPLTKDTPEITIEASW